MGLRGGMMAEDMGDQGGAHGLGGRDRGLLESGDNDRGMFLFTTIFFHESNSITSQTYSLHIMF